MNTFTFADYIEEINADVKLEIEVTSYIESESHSFDCEGDAGEFEYNVSVKATNALLSNAKLVELFESEEWLDIFRNEFINKLENDLRYAV